MIFISIVLYVGDAIQDVNTQWQQKMNAVSALTLLYGRKKQWIYSGTSPKWIHE